MLSWKVSQGNAIAKGLVSTCNSLGIVSCKKHDVSDKSNAQKWSLTDTMYLAKVIVKIAARFAHVHEHKIGATHENFVAMIESNKEMTKFTNDIMVRIVGDCVAELN